MAQSTVTLVGGALITAAGAGPLAQTFDELALVLALCGALGGLWRGLITFRAPIKEAIGKALLYAVSGAIVAFGVGGLLPDIIERLMGVDLSDGGGSIRLLAAGAFLIGYLQERAIEYLLARAKDSKK